MRRNIQFPGFRQKKSNDPSVLFLRAWEAIYGAGWSLGFLSSQMKYNEYGDEETVGIVKHSVTILLQVTEILIHNNTYYTTAQLIDYSDAMANELRYELESESKSSSLIAITNDRILVDQVISTASDLIHEFLDFLEKTDIEEEEKEKMKLRATSVIGLLDGIQFDD